MVYSIELSPTYTEKNKMQHVYLKICLVTIWAIKYLVYGIFHKPYNFVFNMAFDFFVMVLTFGGELWDFIVSETMEWWV